MICLAESLENLPPSPSIRDLKANIEAAQLLGAQVFTIPPDFSACETAENALSHVPLQNKEMQAIWLGYIPDYERYKAIYRAALEKNICLINSPEQHLRVQEFDVAYPFISKFTPYSRTAASIDECVKAAREIGFPVFVKGTVQSRKSRGWRACIAEDIEELISLCSTLFELKSRTRGRVIVRQLVKLRHSRSYNEFPLGREYRVFLFRDKVLSLGYYWEGEDELAKLQPDEQQHVEALARQASQNLEVPFITVDIGQDEDEKWWVIETGDAQFSGVSQTNPLKMWSQLINLVSTA